MPFLHVQQPTSDPILVMTFSGKITTQDMLQSGEAIQPFMAGLNTIPFVIIDLTHCTTDFTEILHMLRMSKENPHGEAQNQRIAFVGTDHMMRLFLAALRQPQFVGVALPTFVNLEDAIAAARLKLNTMQAE